MNKLVITAVVAAIAFGTLAETHERRRHEHERTHERGRSHERGKLHERGRHDGRGMMQANPGAKLHRFSTAVEKERPQLNQETRDLIAAYRRDPSVANYAALRADGSRRFQLRSLSRVETCSAILYVTTSPNSEANGPMLQ